jgi:predicted nucleic acid-binding protein
MTAIGPVVFMDTAFVVAMLNRDDAYHYPAQFFAAVVEKRGATIVTTTAVLIEAGAVQRRDV